MTPEDKQLLDTYVKEIAKILYKNTPSQKIETFEGIETAVRDQVLEHVNPKIAFFLSEKKREQQRGKQRSLRSCVGKIKITNRQASRLGIEPYRRFSGSNAKK